MRWAKSFGRSDRSLQSCLEGSNRGFELTTAVFTAVALLLGVHWAILVRFLAALLLRREGSGANHRREDRHQDCRCCFHLIDSA